MKNNEIYVAPDSKIYLVQLREMIATSGGSDSSKTADPYKKGDTDDWFE